MVFSIKLNMFHFTRCLSKWEIEKIETFLESRMFRNYVYVPFLSPSQQNCRFSQLFNVNNIH